MQLPHLCLSYPLHPPTPAMTSHWTWSTILAEHSGSGGKCYWLGKKSNAISPSKFWFKWRTRFVRITDTRVAMLDHLGNRRRLLIFNSAAAAMLSVHLSAVSVSSSWAPWLFWIRFVWNTRFVWKKYLSRAVSGFCNIVYRGFLLPWSLGNSGGLDTRGNWD